MNREPDFVADLSSVQEVALLGGVDQDFWAARLADEALRPILRDGRAQLLITAMSGVFKGLRFRELSVAVLAVDPDWPDRPGALLVHAFHSSRLLACCERFWFHTPYWPAAIGLRMAPSACATVSTPAGGRLELAMNPPAGGERLPVREGPGGWQGFVHLPSRARRGRMVRRWFFALLEGETSTYTAAPDDLWVVSAAPDAPVLRDLVDSRFALLEWRLRASARHARSQTYLRDWRRTGPELCGGQAPA